MANYPNFKVIENIEDLKGKTIKDIAMYVDDILLVTKDNEYVEIYSYIMWEDKAKVYIKPKNELLHDIFYCSDLDAVESLVEDVEAPITNYPYTEPIEFLIRNEIVNKEEILKYLNVRKQELSLKKQKIDKVNEDKEYKEYLRLKEKYEKN